MTERPGITPESTPVPPRVVVVDDTEGNRYVVSRLLRGAGMNVLEAATGFEGLELAQTKPDLIILDINLPDISGREVLQRIRANPEIDWIPVMHVTASYAGSDNHALGLDMGADAYATHPIDPPVFIATVRSLLRVSVAEARVRRASQEWRAAFDGLMDSIFIISGGSKNITSRKVQRCNRSAAALLGEIPRDIIGRRWGEVLEKMGADVNDFPDGNTKSQQPKDVMVGDRCYSVTMQRSVLLGSDHAFGI